MSAVFLSVRIKKKNELQCIFGLNVYRSRYLAVATVITQQLFHAVSADRRDAAKYQRLPVATLY